jgi:hypothetical protein
MKCIIAHASKYRKNQVSNFFILVNLLLENQFLTLISVFTDSTLVTI